MKYDTQEEYSYEYGKQFLDSAFISDWTRYEPKLLFMLLWYLQSLQSGTQDSALESFHVVCLCNL